MTPPFESVSSTSSLHGDGYRGWRLRADRAERWQGLLILVSLVGLISAIPAPQLHGRGCRILAATPRLPKRRGESVLGDGGADVREQLSALGIPIAIPVLIVSIWPAVPYLVEL